MCLMASLSLVGNVSVIAATISSNFLHTSSHILVACLCFFHLLTGLLSMIPIAITCLTSQWVGGGKTVIFNYEQQELFLVLRKINIGVFPLPFLAFNNGIGTLERRDSRAQGL